MLVEISVKVRDAIVLPDTATCRVEVRDVTYADAASETVVGHEESVAARHGAGTVLQTTLEVPSAPGDSRRLNAWAHVSMTGDRRVQRGDYLSTVAYPLDTSVDRISIEVELKRI